jgi:ADP-ribosylglycohydrolase
LREKLETLTAALCRGDMAEQFAAALGLTRGVSGFINHTVPVALFCWLRYPTDFRAAVEQVILLGGDSDTTAAIVGGLLGATLGANAIPADWLANIAEWPRSTRWMRQLGARLAAAVNQEGVQEMPRLFWPGILLRNIFFLVVVLTHGIRRLFPPY